MPGTTALAEERTANTGPENPDLLPADPLVGLEWIRSSTWTSPITGDPYQIWKDISGGLLAAAEGHEGTYRFDGLRGSFPSPRAIMDAELADLGLDGDLFKADADLRELHAAGDLAPTRMIATLRAQPVSVVAPGVWAEYDPIIDEATARLHAEEDPVAREAIHLELEALREAAVVDILDLAAADVATSSADAIEAIEAAGFQAEPLTRVLNTVLVTGPAALLDDLTAIEQIALVGLDSEVYPELSKSVPSTRISAYSAFGGGPYDVAVLDTGVATNHPALDAQIIVSEAFLDGRAAAGCNILSTDDDNGHGTHVAGIIASEDSTHHGMLLNSYYGTIYNVKVMCTDLNGKSSGTNADALLGMEWAATHSSDQAEVLSMSFGAPGGEDTASTSMYSDALVNALRKTVVTSAGNGWLADGTRDPTNAYGSPASGYNLISVGGVDDDDSTGRSDDSLYTYTSRGYTGDGRANVDVLAPGVGIKSAAHDWDGGIFNSNPNFVSKTGTSMAAPHVSGAALRLYHEGQGDPLTIKTSMMNTADRDLSNPTTGKPNAYGYGYIDMQDHYDHHVTNNDILIDTITAATPYKFYRLQYPVSSDTVTVAWERDVTRSTSPPSGSEFAWTDLDLIVYDESSSATLTGSYNSAQNNEYVQGSDFSGVSDNVIKLDWDSTSNSANTQERFALATTWIIDELAAPELQVSMNTLPTRLGDGDSFTVTATVQNTGDIRLRNVDVVLGMNSGWALNSGSQTQTITSLAGGATQTLTWSVRDSSASCGNHVFSVSADSYTYHEDWEDSASRSTRLNCVPSLNLIEPDGGDDLRGTFFADWTVSDGDGDAVTSRLYRSGSTTPLCTTTASSCSVSTTGIADGFYSLWVTGTDAWDTGTSNSVSVSIDNTDPNLSISLSGSTGSGGWYTSSVTVTLNCSDATSGVGLREYSLNGGAYQTYFGSVGISTQGTTSVAARCYDQAGNLDTASTSFKIDSVDPLTSRSVSGTPGDNGWYISPVTVSLSCSDSGSLCDYTRYRVGSGSWSTYASPFSVTQQGQTYVYYYSLDNAGNSENTRTYVAKIDEVAPVLTPSLSGTSGSGGWYTSAVTVTLGCTDSASGVGLRQYSLNGGAYQTYSSPFSVSSQGTTTVDARCYDQAGHLDTASTSFKIDSVDPVTSRSLSGTLGDNGWYTSPVTVSLSCSDSGSGCAQTWYRIGSGSWTAYASPFPVTVQGGVYVYSYSVDQAGNVESTDSVYLKVDTTDPSISLSSPAEAKTSNSFTVSWSGSDGQSGYSCTDVQYQVNGGSWQTWLNCTTSSSQTFSGTQGNTYGFRARAHDVAGRTSDWPATAMSSTYINRAPHADAGPDQSVGLAFAAATGVDLDGSGSYDLDGTITQYCWNYDDGSSTSCSSSPTRNHRYTSTGTYYARLTVRDNDNRTDSDTVRITVTVV